MDTTTEALGNQFRTILFDEAEHLVDFSMQLMDREIAEGWRAYHARAVWLRKHLPSPLINDLGREYMTERLREAIWTVPGETGTRYRSAFLARFLGDPGARRGYRNFLDVGQLDIEAGLAPNTVFDQTANEVATRMMDHEHVHMEHACFANERNWFMEALERAVRYKEILKFPRRHETPERIEGVPLHRDGCYWRAVHHVEWSEFSDGWYVMDWYYAPFNIRLMAEMAPDFAYLPEISSPQWLLFAKPAAGPFAWALSVERGSRDTFNSPRLMLIQREARERLCEADVVFRDVFEKPVFDRVFSPPGLETDLMRYLPRLRRLAEFYTPFLEAALAKAGAQSA